MIKYDIEETLRQYDAGNVRDSEFLINLLRQAVTMVRDAERLDWLERNLFDKHWDGCIGRPEYWSMAGPYRHTLQKMRGNDLREAIDAAMQQERSSDDRH